MDLKHLVDSKYLKDNKENIKKVFFYRICGTGMGAAAILFKECGLHVEGADIKFYPPMGDYLKSSEIKCHNLENFDLATLKDFDLIVVGNVVPRMSEEARALEQVGVAFCSFPQALGSLVLGDKEVVGLSGTHGKTTTTYFAAQMFEKLGAKPGYFVGGVIDGQPSSKLGEGDLFFIESDEYDSAYFQKISKFRLYSINHLVITSLEFDHADIYENIEQIKDQFRELIPSVDKNVIACSDYPYTHELLGEFPNIHSRLHWYGQKDKHHKITSATPDQTNFTLKYNDQDLEFSTNVIGAHNIDNICSCVILALDLGYSQDDINKSIQDLKMVKRRQEIKGHHGESIIIDDFAHHPRAVAATIESIKQKYPDRKIFLVFDPASATARSEIFQKEFAESMKAADEVIITQPSRPTTVKDREDLDLNLLQTDIVDKFKVKSGVVSSLDELRSKLNEWRDTKSVTLVLSNGVCLGLWESEFINEIKK